MFHVEMLCSDMEHCCTQFVRAKVVYSYRYKNRYYYRTNILLRVLDHH